MKSFPNKKEIKHISKKLEKVPGTKSLSKNASTLEKFRFELQQKFVEYKIENNCTQKEMAARLFIDEAKISKILHNRLDDFSTDRLITLCEKLSPDIKLAVG